MSEWRDLLVNGRGNVSNLNRFGAATNWEAVRVDNGDSSYAYVEDTTGFPVAAADFYNIEPLAGDVTEILEIALVLTARIDGGTYFGSWYTLSLELSGQFHDEPERVFPNGSEDWRTVGASFPLNPWTGQPWTVAEVASLEIGQTLRVQTSSPPSPVDLRTTLYKARAHVEVAAPVEALPLAMGVDATPAALVGAGLPDLGLPLDATPAGRLSVGAADLALPVEVAPSIPLKTETQP